jgi:hypothetical protein
VHDDDNDDDDDDTISGDSWPSEQFRPGLNKILRLACYTLYAAFLLA